MTYDAKQVIAINWSDNDYTGPVLDAMKLMCKNEVPQDKKAIIEVFRYMVYSLDQLRRYEMGRELSRSREFYTESYFLLREDQIAIGPEVDSAISKWAGIVWYDNRSGGEFWHVV